MAQKHIILIGLLLPFTSAIAQVSPDETGVADEALQHSFDDYMSFSYSHGKLCSETLKKVLPGISGIPQKLAATINMAGILTSNWKQTVIKPDGTGKAVWDFECVSQLRSGSRVRVISLVMYQERGAMKRGVELLTNRDVRISHSPK